MFLGYRKVIHDPVWVKILTLATTLFFAFLADAILSFWVPNFLEGIYVDTSKVGLIMAFSSFVGLFCDLTLPQILKGVTVRKLTFFAILASFTFPFILFLSSHLTVLFLVLSSMAVWGVYYELLGFAQQQFVADSTPIKFHPAAWGILGVFKSLAYFIGPILASLFLDYGLRIPLFAAMFFSFISLLLVGIYRKEHDRALLIDTTKVSLVKEFSHWIVLIRCVWPVVTMGLFLGLIDSFFWTVGPIWSEELAKIDPLGGMFVSFYVLPSLFMGFVVAKWGVYKGKKKLAAKIFIVAGVVLSLLSLSGGVYWQLGVVLVASTAIAAIYPLVDGVYSDIVARMGREREHMIGLTNSTLSVAYLFGPPVSGIIASLVGERNSFAVVGGVSAAVSLVLLLTIPKKIHLPQKEISTWK